MSVYQSYLRSVSALLAEVSEDELQTAASLLWECFTRSARLVLCGNGGSAATASHLVADFQKNVFLACGRPWEVVALTDSSPLMTAWSNDTDYTNVFAGQARCWLRPGDLLIAISGSGNSPNVLAAVEAAKEIGAASVGLCGYGGGKLAHLADHAVVLHSYNMQQVEDAHMVIGHLLYTVLVERIAAQPGAPA